MSGLSGLPVKQCGAKTRNGGTCKQPAMPNGRCRLHGGKSLSGVAHPRFKGAGYSKYLPAKLLDIYQEALADPELLSLRSDVAVLHARVTELMTRLADGEHGKLWTMLQSAHQRFTDARTTGNREQEASALTEMGRLIANGCSQEKAWREVEEAIERKADIAAREWKRQVDMQQVITAERALALITAVMLTVKRHVSDQQALLLISNDVQGLLRSSKGKANVDNAGQVPLPGQGMGEVIDVQVQADNQEEAGEAKQGEQPG